MPVARWRGLQHQRHKDRELTEANTMFAQRATGILVQCLHVISNIPTWEDAQRFNHLERKAARKASQLFVARQV